MNNALQQKLGDAGVPFETLKVFGVMRINVHVTCISEGAANRWVDLLGAVCPGAQIIMKPTILDAPHSKKGRMWKHKKGYLIVVNDRAPT